MKPDADRGQSNRVVDGAGQPARIDAALKNGAASATSTVLPGREGAFAGFALGYRVEEDRSKNR